MERNIRGLFANQSGHLARALAETKGKYVDKEELRREIDAFKASWPELKEKIRNQIYPFDEVKEMLRKAGAPYEPEMICVTREKLRSTFKGIPYMRTRFNGIDIIFRLGLMDECLDYLFDGPSPVFKAS